MKAKKFLTGLLAGLLAFGAVGAVDVEAATRDEIAAIHVNRKGSNFKYWTKNAAALDELKSYVRDVTNRRSPNFIPVEDRIAVFDMDGTILCETAPYYFDGMLFIHRAAYDNSYAASDADRDFAISLEEAIASGNLGDMLNSSAPHQAAVFEGMTDAELTAYVDNFMKTPVIGLSHLKYGESFYLPMVEVIKYLHANDFQVYIVSGTDRDVVRILACDVLEIPRNRIIGTDVKILAANQGGADGLDYTFGGADYLIRGEFVVKNLQMNKVSVIAREIGKQPVLAFGNSSGDSSMLNYTIVDNPHKSRAFFVICDDVERELGSIPKAEKCVALAKKNGWVPISMRDDFKTIYGDNVARN